MSDGNPLWQLTGWDFLFALINASILTIVFMRTHCLIQLLRLLLFDRKRMHAY